MIITTSKDLQEVKDAVSKFGNLFIIGCGDCCAVCKTGGTEEVKQMVEDLKEIKEIKSSIVIEAPCDARVAKRDLRRVKKDIEAADAVLAMTCGLGAQSLAALIKKPIIPANNTLGMGIIQGMGTAKLVCIGCDKCVLLDNNGTCPVMIKQVCGDCQRILAHDAKCCDLCGSKNLSKKDEIVTHTIL